MSDKATIHASAVLVGPKAALIRGPSGSGKSQLAFALIQAAGRGALPFARLVADDRVHVAAIGGQLLLRPAPELAGLLEIRGLGPRRLPHEPLAAATLVVDLASADAERLPGAQSAHTTIEGITLPRLAVATGQPGLPLLLAFLASSAAGN